MVGSNVSDITADQPFDDVSMMAKASLVASHCISVAALATCTAVLRMKIDLRHPVFAVVYQESLLLLGLSLASLVGLLVLVNGHFLAWIGLVGTVGVVAVQLHQMSWFAVTCLRYHFLVRLTPAEVEMADLGLLKRQCLILVCLGAAIFSLATFSYWAALLFVNGFPRVRFVDMDSIMLNRARILGPIVYNIPDYVSIVIYIKMWHHFWRRKRTAVTSPLPIRLVQDKGQDSLSEIDWQPPQEENMETDSILRTLATHVAVSLFDLLAKLPTLIIPDPQARQVFLSHCNIAISFWLPVLVISRNFNRVNGVVLKDVFKELCGIWV